MPPDHGRHTLVVMSLLERASSIPTTSASATWPL
jgi:hypothetical protein